MDAIGNGREIKSMQLGTYNIIFTSKVLQIGCENFEISEWRGFSDNRIIDMDTGALEWWNKWKDFIFKTIELSTEVSK